MKNSKNKIKKHVKDQKQKEKWSFCTFPDHFKEPWKKKPKETMTVITVATAQVGVSAKDRPSFGSSSIFWLKLTNPEKLIVDPVDSVFDAEFSYRPLIVTVGLLGFAWVKTWDRTIREFKNFVHGVTRGA